MKLSAKQRKEGLAQVHNLRRRLAERDFSDIVDKPDTPDANVVNLAASRRKGKGYDPDHPVMVRARRDIDG